MSSTSYLKDPFTLQEKRVISNPDSSLVTHLLGSHEGTPEHRFYQKRVKRAQLSPGIMTEIEDLSLSQGRMKSPGESFSFMDLFAGIGGMRLAAEAAGGKCLFSSEWDSFAKQTYFRNFGEIPFGDITKIPMEEIPHVDLLMGGFPCQAFSLAGHRRGFSDTRGTLFFNVAKIVEAKSPRFLLLENVKGLLSHDSGRTLKTIMRVLESDLGYYVPTPEVLNSKDFGLPQNRERVYLVAFKHKRDFDRFEYPKVSRNHSGISSVLERRPVEQKHFLTPSTLRMLENHRDRHASKGNGFGMMIIDDSAAANAVIVGGMGRERNLVVDKRIFENIEPSQRRNINSSGVRRLTPREFARLQGFPNRFAIPVSDSQAYKQFGNSVSVPVVTALVRNIISTSI